MKVGILVCLILVAGCQANFLDGLKATLQSVGNVFTDTFKQVGEQAKVVGQGLLDQLKSQGTQLAGQALQSLLLGASGALSGTSSGKRAVLPQRLEQFIGEKIDQMTETFKSTVDALETLGENSHSTKLTELVATVDELVHTHNAALNKILLDLIHGAEDHFAEALSQIPHHKRNGFTDLLGAVGNHLATFFQPHVDALKQVVGTLGQGVTQTAQQLQTQAQPHVDALTTSGHEVLNHGKNALQALKDAVTDILHQTLTNVQPHLTNIVAHATTLATQTAGQVAKNLGATVLSALGASAQSPEQV